MLRAQQRFSTLWSCRQASRQADARAASFWGMGRPVAEVTGELLGRNTRERKGDSALVAKRGRSTAYL